MKPEHVLTHLLPKSPRPSLSKHPSTVSKPPDLSISPLQPSHFPSSAVTKKCQPAALSPNIKLAIPAFSRHFRNGEELIRRIPCSDFVNALLDREPFAETVLVQNMMKLREKTAMDGGMREEESEDSPFK